MKRRHMCWILCCGFGLTACGSSQKEVRQEQAKNKTVASTASQSQSQPQRPKVQATPWGGCKEAVEATAGLVVQCPSRTIVMSQWTKSSAASLLMHVRQHLNAEEAIESTPHVIDSLNQKINGVAYAQKQPKRQGIVIALEDKQGRARTVNCMVAESTHVPRCEADLAEISRLGDLPIHLRPRPQVAEATPLIPRLVDLPLTVPTGCRWYKTKILCADDTVLLWKKVSAREPEGFDQRFATQLERGLKGEFDEVKAQKGACRSVGKTVACTRFLCKKEATTSTPSRRHVVVVAPAQRKGERFVVMCSSPGHRRTRQPEVCKQVLSWSRAKVSKAKKKPSR